MTARLVELPFSESLSERLAAPPRRRLRVYWLGQAGFVIEGQGRRVAIDPYLSDTLAKKYAASPYSHARMTPAPVAPDELGELDLVLCTHHHTDHMDPGTLAPLARRWPRLRFAVPAASLALARERIGVGDDRLVAMEAGKRVQPSPGLIVDALRSAHETLEFDEGGRCRFLGYIISGCGGVIYHSGDCAPFDGLSDELAAHRPDLALLPVNGRSAALRAAGFAGNFTIEEALALCHGRGIPAMIAHHYGMFAFNTVEPAVLDAALARASLSTARAKLQVAYTLGLD